MTRIKHPLRKAVLLLIIATALIYDIFVAHPGKTSKLSPPANSPTNVPTAAPPPTPPAAEKIAPPTTAPVITKNFPAAENLLPADTLAFFTVPDGNAFRAAGKKSPTLEFWNDPAMKPFHDKLVARFTEKFIAPLEHDLGVKIADFLDLPQGQFTLAITVAGAGSHQTLTPGLLLLLDAQAKTGTLKTNLTTLTQKWTDAGRAVRTEKIHGLDFTVVPVDGHDFPALFPKPEAKPAEIFFTQFGTLLVAGTSAPAVESVAARLTGGSTPVLADNPVFAADRLAQFRDAPVDYGWFNGRAFVNLLSQGPENVDDPTASPFAPKFSTAKIIGATGLGGLKSISFAQRETADGSALAFHVSAPAAERTGLLKILAVPAKDAAAPAFVPADVVKYSRLRLDGRETWAELQKMVAAISPQGLASLNSVIDMANNFSQSKTPGFDLRTALFGNLGDDFISYQKAPAGDSLESLTEPPTLFLLAVVNPEQTIDAIKTVAALSAPQNPAESPREFLGRKIHTITLRSNHANLNGSSKANPVYLAASGGYLAFSGDLATLEEYLRSADGRVKPLRENSALADAAQHVGGTGGGLFGYENQRETMRAAFKLLKNSAAADTSLKMFPPEFRAWADFSLLPDYAAVQKYFNFSVYAGNANADGLDLKVFAPRPSQLP